MVSTKKAKPCHIPTLQDKDHYVKQKPLSENDTCKLKSLLHDHFEWMPRSFQIDVIQVQLLGRDAIIHASTGCWAPFPSKAEGIHHYICFTPNRTARGVHTFKKEFSLAALAVSSNHDGCSPLVMKNILHGSHNIIILSPEMLLSRTFMDKILLVVVDEAYVISHWGARFRKQYGKLGKIHSFIQRGTPIITLSATLSCHVCCDVLTKLQFPKDGYISIDVGNDRPNISLAVRAIHNPMNTFANLKFVIPRGVEKADDIPLTYLYYCTEVMSQFRKEQGCNLLNVELVVQWRLLKKLSTFVQRAGRAARAPGRTGLAVLLVEKSVYGKVVGIADPKTELNTKGCK
ncbi:hypothetical protein BDN71DRAFT_1524508 [Pleurotus eryngii]|uniref:DNA 3'-5' helicase n=1 Tax=Pleurotus eryngii TaxID=5323 RepID=A0A9P5ZP04_PLEER|nr:hypothetical protein BDN71DRAFT_1524508 [Pleurotus eryngii]